jgi:hypothetical protein
MISLKKQNMKKNLLLLMFAFSTTFAFGQYEGTPWNGTPWKFGQNNEENLENNRILTYQYDVGPAQSPAGPGEFFEPADALTWVTGHRNGVGGSAWSVLATLPTLHNLRITEAEEKNIELDATDVALINGWSNFQWDADQKRIRNGASWRRFTVEFEPGLYKVITRGRNGAGGNFGQVMTLRNPETMEVIWTKTWVNQAGVATGETTYLGQTPVEPYNLLPFVHNDQHWYILNEVLELDGKYILEQVNVNAGAVGTTIGEITFETMPPDKPTITAVTATPENIDGCDGQAVITVTATPENEGGAVEYRLSLTGVILQDWTPSNEFTVYYGGTYTVQAREVGFILWDEKTIDIAKINCQPTPYEGTAQVIPGKVQFERFDVGGFRIAYNEISSPFSNLGDWTDRNDEENGLMGKDLFSRYSLSGDTLLPDTAYHITVSGWGNNTVKTSEWAIYTVEVEDDGDFEVTLNHFTNVNVGRNFQVEFYNEDMTELIDSLYNLRIPGNWDRWAQDAVPTFPWKYSELAYPDRPISLKKGTYKMKFYSNAFDFHLDNLEFKKLDDIAATLWVEETTVQETVPFRISAQKNVDVYLTPAGTSATDDIPALSIRQLGLIANDTVNFSTIDIAAADYVMYAIDKLGNVSAPVNVKVEELVRPVIIVEEWQVFPGFPFEITMDMNGTVYLVPDGTEQDDNIVGLALKAEPVTANTKVDMFTDGLDLGDYMLYGINDLGIVSEGIKAMVTLNPAVVTISSERIQVFPIPTNSMLYINSGSPVKHVEVYSILGTRVMYSDQISGSLDVSQLKKGIYLVKIATEQTPTATFRIIIK